MRNLSERVAALSPAKLGLLEQILRKNVTEGPEAQIVPRDRRADALPLSFAQERLWFLEQFQPGSPVYNIPLSMRMPGPLNIRALNWSINEVVRRHEVLRTSFPNRRGCPAQVIAPEMTLDLPISDLQTYLSEDREREARRIATEEVRGIFDLSRVPLLRARLLRWGPEDHVLLLTVHHIVADGWSIGILLQELSVLYQAARSGKPSPLPPLRLQYADFSQWQRNWLTSERLKSEVTYWRERLAGAPTVLALPTDRSRPTVQTYAGGLHVFTCSLTTTAQLRQIARELGGTLFMVLLAGFKTLLYRYTRQSDVVVGTPIASRNRTELEGLIGFFVNTLALRTDLSGDPQFLEVVRRVKSVTVGAYEHQDLPFEKLVEEIQPERNLGHHPVFQVLFALQNTPTVPADSLAAADSSQPDVHEVGTGTAKFDISVFFRETTRGMSAGIEYNTDLFEQSTIERMSSHFESLLTQIAANPERRLSDYSLLTEAERHQLTQWNRTKVAFSAPSSLTRLLESHAERTPKAAAVEFNGKTLTYRELNRRANQLAHILRQQGVGPDVCVGSCMESSLDLAIVVTGILKAGGVYVPLDPSFPQQRLSFMIDNSRVAVLLTQQRFAAMFEGYGATLVVLDSDSWERTKPCDQNPIDDVDPENLAYVIYTSGSTGTPKGVAVPHRTLSNLVAWQIANSPGHKDVATLQFASPSFDVSLQEMFATWCAGGKLILAADDVRHDPPALLRKLKDDKLERLFLSPVALRSLAAAVTSGSALPALKQVIVAGEALQITEAIASMFLRLDDCLLYNQYGPSETHVVSEFLLEGPFANRSSLPPIGRPIANTQLYTVDWNTVSLTPVGIPGELCIGGVSLARGYTGRPDLTAEKFIPNPFGDEPGARLYRTGDLARFRSDGNIEFLGRIDQQVKIRGFRIEVGEVESALMRHPSVKDVAVVAQEEPGSDRRLVAYAVNRAGETPNVSDLRRFLNALLPGYMVPSAFVFVDSLPLTPTGKLDRRALPVPERTRPLLDRGFVGPRGPLEETLAKIWADVLQLERVGIYDSFFDLGGHSLLATQIISRVRNVFQMELPVSSLFSSPSVAEFAALIDAATDHKVQDANVKRSISPVSNGQAGDELHEKSAEHLDAPLISKSVEADPEVSRITERPQHRVPLESGRGSDPKSLASIDHLSDEQVSQLLTELLREKNMGSFAPAPLQPEGLIDERAEPIVGRRTAASPVETQRANPHDDANASPPVLPPDIALAEVHRQHSEAQLQCLHGQQMIWLDTQRRVSELYLQHLQMARDIEINFLSQVGATPSAGWRPEPPTKARGANPPIDPLSPAKARDAKASPSNPPSGYCLGGVSPSAFRSATTISSGPANDLAGYPAPAVRTLSSALADGARCRDKLSEPSRRYTVRPCTARWMVAFATYKGTRSESAHRSVFLRAGTRGALWRQFPRSKSTTQRQRSPRGAAIR